MPERLQKVLARTGVGSRRMCESIIRDGRVTVNGRVAVLGTKADPDVDDIRLDGERIECQEKPVYVALYKPAGVLSSNRSQGGKPILADLVDIPQRAYPVGRLDLNSEGLILLTNDGELTNLLLHPRYGHEKEYRVLLSRFPKDAQIEAMRSGVVLPEGVKSLPNRVWLEDPSSNTPWLRMILRQGRKRQIRETMKVLGLRVRQLIRVRIGPIQLGDLKPGEWRYLTNSEVALLKRSTKARKSRSRGVRGKRNVQGA